MLDVMCYLSKKKECRRICCLYRQSQPRLARIGLFRGPARSLGWVNTLLLCVWWIQFAVISGRDFQLRGRQCPFTSWWSWDCFLTPDRCSSLGVRCCDARSAKILPFIVPMDDSSTSEGYEQSFASSSLNTIVFVKICQAYLRAACRWKTLVTEIAKPDRRNLLRAL